MTNEPSIDLAKLDAWRGVRPGMARSQVEEILRSQAGVEVQEYGSDGLTATTDDWELTIKFTTDGSNRLCQVTIDGDAVVWEGQPLIDLRIDDAWRLLGSPTTAVWEAAYRDEDDPSPEGELPATIPDEELVEEGTIWLPERGLGFSIYEGEVIDVVWRSADHLPTRFDGPLTEAQRQLSKRADLERHLDAWRAKQYKVEETKDPLSPLRKIVAIAAIAALAMVGQMGFDEMRLWGDAPNLQAKFIAVETVPMKQFRDYLPPALRWMAPRGKPVIVEAYRVEFTTPEDARPQQVVLERGELYVPPQNPGDEVPVAYVAGDPPRIKGLSRARDSAFVDYMPWAIAISLLWLVVHYLIGLLPTLLKVVPRLMKKLAPSDVIQDSDRPELR
jgi:hypothetical protein